MIAVCGGNLEILVLRWGLVKDTIPDELEPHYFELDYSQTPPGLSLAQRRAYMYQALFEYLLRVVHFGAEGWKHLHSWCFQEVGLERVENEFAGDWEHAIIDMLCTKVLDREAYIYRHKHPVISTEHFRLNSQATGMRGNVAEIDRILARDGVAKDEDRHLLQMYGVNHLRDLVEACESFLEGHGTSARRGAVEKLLYAARCEYAVISTRNGDFLKVKDLVKADPRVRTARCAASGMSLLGAAAHFGSEKQIEQIRDTFKVDINQLQQHGWYPLDWARTENSWRVEAALSALDAKSRCAEVSEPNTVEALVEATAVPATMHVRTVEGCFETLYENDLFKPILDMAAMDARRERVDKTGGLRLFFALGRDCAQFRTGMAPVGNYDVKNNTLGFASRGDFKPVQGGGQESPFTYYPREKAEWRTHFQASMESTVIHELTHFAVAKIWNNNALPYGKVDQLNLTPQSQAANEAEAALLAYAKAYLADLTLEANRETLVQGFQSGDPYDHVDTCGLDPFDASNARLRLYFTLFGHVLGYGDRGRDRVFVHDDAFLTGNGVKGYFTTGVMQEVVSHISQALHNQGGQAAVSAMIPSTFAWYRDVFLAKARAAATPSIELGDDADDGVERALGAPLERSKSSPFF